MVFLLNSANGLISHLAIDVGVMYFSRLVFVIVQSRSHAHLIVQWRSLAQLVVQCTFNCTMYGILSHCIDIPVLCLNGNELGMNGLAAEIFGNEWECIGNSWEGKGKHWK